MQINFCPVDHYKFFCSSSQQIVSKSKGYLNGTIEGLVRKECEKEREHFANNRNLFR